MTEFTVEATVSAVNDGDWSELHRVLDLVPGTLLIADADEPVLIFPVNAETPMRAGLFVDGISKLVGLALTSVSVTPTPEVDFEVGDEHVMQSVETSAEQVVNEWIDSVPPFEGRVNGDGVVERV